MRWCFFSPGHRSIKVLSGDTRTSGGAEAQIARLAEALARLGNEVTLIFGDGRAQESREVIAGVTCIDAAPTWRRPSSMMHFWQTVNALSPDIIYARLPSDFLWMMGLFARRHRGARFIYAIANDMHCSTWGSYSYNRWFHCPLYALGLMSANAIAVQHDGQEQLLGSRFNDRIVRVPNLVSSISSKQREFSKTIYDAVWIAQIRPVKQLGRFLDVVEASPDLRFAVVGGHDPMTGSDDYTMLNKRMTELNNLQYLGPLRAEEVSAVLAQSRTLVNTSQAEGFPNTMLEAWSLGIPVVSLSVDPGEVIRREKLGIVSGSVANLPHDVHALARNEALNRECGHNGLNYVRRRHSLTAVCEALAVAAPGSTLLPNAPEFPDALSEA